MGKNDGFVLIHGKQYATVAHRLMSFRKLYPTGQILTTLECDDNEKVIMKSIIILDGLEIATGWAEEVRGSSPINKTSALENCETSAIGRALAIAGFDTSGQIASAEEVKSAIEQQAVVDENEIGEIEKEIVLDDELMDDVINEEQERAIGNFLEDQEDGADLLQSILDKANINHLRELSQKHAEACMSRWSIEV